jgi:hypothetical protein
MHLVTIPGHVFFLPNEVPARVAEVIRMAIADIGSQAFTHVGPSPSSGQHRIRS